MASRGSWIRHAWNPFEALERNPNPPFYPRGASFGDRPDRSTFRMATERSIIASIYTRLSVDVSSIHIRHVRLDDEDRFIENIDSGLNSCLTLEANVDQAATAFIQDIVMSMCERGTVAIVPIDSTLDPNISGSFDIKTMRVGEITQWYARHVKVRVWDDREEKGGIHREILIEKRLVAIVENPLYSVMNEPNSTLQRLLRKLNLLDTVDEATSSGKLDLIVQLPYAIKSESRKAMAESRRADLEFQLKGSKYGIAYMDGTEKITQLNRPTENNLLTQIEKLYAELYVQLGLTVDVMNGTANEATMLNYINRTVEPIVRAIVEAMRRTFLTKTARSQGQSITYFRDPFKLVPIADVAEIADKFTRNEVATANEIRQAIGWKPSKDPKADQLVNSNMPVQDVVPAQQQLDLERNESQNGT